MIANQSSQSSLLLLAYGCHFEGEGYEGNLKTESDKGRGLDGQCKHVILQVFLDHVPWFFLLRQLHLGRQESERHWLLLLAAVNGRLLNARRSGRLRVLLYLNVGTLLLVERLAGVTLVPIPPLTSARVDRVRDHSLIFTLH